MGQNRLQNTVLFQPLDTISLKLTNLLLVPTTARWRSCPPPLGRKTPHYKEISEEASDSEPADTVVGHTANVSIKLTPYAMAHFHSRAKHTLLLESVLKKW